jgi:hypothetical protein
VSDRVKLGVGDKIVVAAIAAVVLWGSVPVFIEWFNRPGCPPGTHFISGSSKRGGTCGYSFTIGVRP